MEKNSSLEADNDVLKARVTELETTLKETEGKLRRVKKRMTDLSEEI
jgi:prefoldin subunit 5